ncbi:hypothetical protein [Herbiconiux sp. UC225_62]
MHAQGDVTVFLVLWALVGAIPVACGLVLTRARPQRIRGKGGDQPH